MKKVLTLCLLREGDRVLLGYKKRGFGQARWNGFGGKVEPGEAIEAAARREMFEESGITIRELEQVGQLDFIFKDENQKTLEVHIFRVGAFAGEPRETEEMRPEWFPKDAIPFADMWADDIYWFPLFFAGKKFSGYFTFDKEDRIHDYRLDEVEKLPRG